MLIRVDPIVFNYRQLLAYIKLENNAAPFLDETIASLIHLLGFYYKETKLEENPKTARFPLDDPYSIAECWARVEGFRECLQELVGRLPTQLGGTAYRQILREMFVEGKETK